jgi:hypothetical protein
MAKKSKRLMNFRGPWKDGRSESASWERPLGDGVHFLLHSGREMLSIVTEDERRHQDHMIFDRDSAAELRDRLTAWLETGSIRLKGERLIRGNIKPEGVTDA